MKNLIDKWVVVCVKMPHQEKPYFFHGKLVKVEKTDLTVDDVKLGMTVFPRESVRSVREMNRLDMIELAEKSERWAMRLKFQQADDKVKKRFEEFMAMFKGTAK